MIVLPIASCLRVEIVRVGKPEVGCFEEVVEIREERRGVFSALARIVGEGFGTRLFRGAGAPLDFPAVCLVRAIGCK